MLNPKSEISRESADGPQHAGAFLGRAVRPPRPGSHHPAGGDYSGPVAGRSAPARRSSRRSPRGPPTPIKEALSRLTTEGLVEVGSRGGTFVTRPTKASVDQILELREVLEQFAAERALAVATEADLAALTALCESIKSRINPDGSLAYEGFSLDDVAFHNMLIGLAGNQRLAQMYRDLHAYTIVARAYYQLRAKGRDTDVSGHMRVYHQHMAIVAALRAGDPIALRAAITDHIAGVREFGHRAAELFAQDRSSDAA